MIKSASYKKTVDGEKCQKIAKDITENEQKFIRDNKLSLNDFFSIELCLRELWQNAKTKTFITSIANTFKKYGFTVTMDQNRINYIIQ
jgi:hypothetical protein